MPASPALVQEILREIFLIEEALGRKGIQSVAGQRLIRRMRQDLRFYFRQVERAIDALQLERLAGIPEAHFIADRMLEPVLLALDPQLNQILISNLEDAFVSGRIFAEKILQRESEFIEQDSEAYAYASARSAVLIRGINETTRKQMRTAIASGIRDRLGVPGLGRLIRRTVFDMSRFRSELIANTEMNEAVTTASFGRYKRAGALFKTTVLSIVPCPICVANEGQGPIPMDQNFQSGAAHPPFHPNCACTLVPAREPQSSQDTLRQGLKALPRDVPTPGQRAILDRIAKNNPEFARVRETLSAYTEGGHEQIQSAARDVIKSGEAVNPLGSEAEVLLNAVRVSPIGDRVVWRGLMIFGEEREGAAVLRLAVGDTWQLLEPQSWSYNRAISAQFSTGELSGLAAGEAGTPVMIELRGASRGINAEAFSAFGGQEEFITNGRFIVVGKRVESGVTIITVEQTGVL